PREDNRRGTAADRRSPRRRRAAPPPMSCRARAGSCLAHRIGKRRREGGAAGAEHAAADQEIGKEDAVDDEILPARRDVAGAERLDEADADSARDREERRAEPADDGADETLDAVAD